MAKTVHIRNTTKGKLPRLPFQAMKDRVLGEKYNLSLVIATNRLSQDLNKKWRGKDKPTNILSFSLGPSQGEIFLNLALAKKQAPDFERTYSNFVAFLLIHGFFHLKGMDHGSKMESEERKVRKEFSLD